MTSRRVDGPDPDRLHVGQLLVHLTRQFQTELYALLVDAGIEGARVPHTHVTAYIRADGSRLTDLATQARMTRPAMAELVDDLERLGMVERRADPTDGRAKLICLTEEGWNAMRTGHAIIAQLEADYEHLMEPSGSRRCAKPCRHYSLHRPMGLAALSHRDRNATVGKSRWRGGCRDVTASPASRPGASLLLAARSGCLREGVAHSRLGRAAGVPA